MADRTITLPDFLTPEQIEQASLCTTARQIMERVIDPNLAAINAKLGQENDPLYLAYTCEYVFRKAGIWR